ncbi:nidogen-like domain-containing protein, partial [Tistrella bauzanensis]
ARDPRQAPKPSADGVKPWVAGIRQQPLWGHKKMSINLAVRTACALGLTMWWGDTAQAQSAFINLSNSSYSIFSANDDDSLSVTPGFTMVIDNIRSDTLWLNNNGNVTFGSALGQYTPESLSSIAVPIIAPFFADVDTRGIASDPVRYAIGSLEGRRAFVADWNGVGYYAAQSDKLNRFQLTLVDRSDTGAGNFDVYFSYDSIQWESGDASGATKGLGGTSAYVGYSIGSGQTVEIEGSGVNGAFLDGGPNSLAAQERLFYTIRNGQIQVADNDLLAELIELAHQSAINGDQRAAEDIRDPVAGSPTSAIQIAAGSDHDTFAMNAFDSTSRSTLAIQYGAYSGQGEDTEVYVLPLSHSFSFGEPDNTFSRIQVSLPVSYTKTDGKSSQAMSLGFGLPADIVRFDAESSPIAWTVTPSIRAGVVHSDDFDTGVLTFGTALSSSLGYAIDPYTRLIMGNTIGRYFAKDRSWINSSARYDYNLNHTILQNGLKIEADTEILKYPSTISAYVNITHISDDDTVIKNYREYGVAIKPDIGLSNDILKGLLLAVSWTDANDYRGGSINFSLPF